MPEVVGITTQKDTEGKITHVTIDVQQHKEKITPMLYELGVMEKTAFQIECENGYSIEEARALTLNYLRTKWNK
jgi:selenocysteine-specific translation elongation factor